MWKRDVWFNQRSRILTGKQNTTENKNYPQQRRCNPFRRHGNHKYMNTDIEEVSLS